MVIPETMQFIYRMIEINYPISVEILTSFAVFFASLAYFVYVAADTLDLGN